MTVSFFTLLIVAYHSLGVSGIAFPVGEVIECEDNPFRCRSVSSQEVKVYGINPQIELRNEQGQQETITIASNMAVVRLMTKQVDDIPEVKIVEALACLEVGDSRFTSCKRPDSQNTGLGLCYSFQVVTGHDMCGDWGSWKTDVCAHCNFVVEFYEKYPVSYYSAFDEQLETFGFYDETDISMSLAQRVQMRNGVNLTLLDVETEATTSSLTQFVVSSDTSEEKDPQLGTILSSLVSVIVKDARKVGWYSRDHTILQNIFDLTQIKVLNVATDPPLYLKPVLMPRKIGEVEESLMKIHTYPLKFVRIDQQKNALVWDINWNPVIKNESHAWCDNKIKKVRQDSNGLYCFLEGNECWKGSCFSFATVGGARIMGMVEYPSTMYPNVYMVNADHDSDNFMHYTAKTPRSVNFLLQSDRTVAVNMVAVCKPQVQYVSGNTPYVVAYADQDCYCTLTLTGEQTKTFLLTTQPVNLNVTQSGTLKCSDTEIKNFDLNNPQNITRYEYNQEEEQHVDVIRKGWPWWAKWLLWTFVGCLPFTMVYIVIKLKDEKPCAMICNGILYLIIFPITAIGGFIELITKLIVCAEEIKLRKEINKSSKDKKDLEMKEYIAINNNSTV